MTASTDDPMIDRVVLGRYRILRHLADGGMGTIYLARNEGSAGFVRPVVIKWVLPTHSGDARITDLFMREARIMAKLSHPEIVSVLDFAEEEGMYIMALEYVHGFPLSRWYRFVKKFRGPFPVDTAVHVGIKVLHALDYAHNLMDEGQALQIVHRDVTPSNILIDMQGHVKLADFGVAGIASEKTAVGDGTLKGKLAYLPPESFDRVPASPLTDVYSTAVTLHEVLMGTNEFGSGDPSMAETIGRVMKHVPTRLDKARPDVSTALAAVIARGLAKNPAQRYQTAAEFARDLSHARINNEAETVFQLKKLAETDFLDERLAAMSSMPQLTELESAWRTPSRPRISGIQRASSPTVPMVDRPPTSSDGKVAESPITPKKSRALIVIVALVGVVVIGGIAWVAISARMAVKGQQTPETKQTFIVVDQRDPGSAGSLTTPDAAVGTIDAAGPAADARVVPADAKKAGTPNPPTTVDVAALTRTFGRQTLPAVTKCFQLGADTLPEAVWLRFEIDTTGNVLSAIAVPESVHATALGRCLEDAGKTTRFGPQPSEATFRIPLQTKRGG